MEKGMNDKEIVMPLNKPLSEEELLKAVGGFGTVYYRWICNECSACCDWSKNYSEVNTQMYAHFEAMDHVTGLLMKIKGAGPD